jgi:cellulose synthase/poly-beta-1,6-N-acetylglucosamine synthase-like glycosyltransferase
MAAYLRLLTAVGAPRLRRNRHRDARPLTFVIMIPAHDEEQMIGATLDAMRGLDHDRFSVHVVADNCTDRTAEIVRAHGFVAHERNSPAAGGKGPALNWLFDRLDRDDRNDFDVAVVVDADTIVDPAFLTELERTFADDVLAVQGHYGVRQPEISAAVGLRAAALAARHHLRPMGRVRLGGSCGLFGNGMAFRRQVLRRHRWTGHLVEDAELQIGLLMDGHRVAYAPDARVFAEMPTTLKRAATQNKRWERGRLQLVRVHGLAVLQQSMRGSPRARAAAVDELFDLLTPPLSVLAGGQVVLAGVNGVGAMLGGRRHRLLLAVNLAALATLVVHVLIALRTVRAPAAVYRSLARAPVYAWWKMRTWIGVLVRPDVIPWTRTARNVEAAN